MNRQEAHEVILTAIEDAFSSPEFDQGEWEVAHNDAVGTISIIHRRSGGVMTLMDITGAHFTGGSDEDAQIHVHLPLKLTS